MTSPQVTSRAGRRWPIATALFFLIAAVGLSGCGKGATSYSDMKRVAIRRTKDVDTPPPGQAKPVPNTAANTAAPAAQTPAKPAVVESSQKPSNTPAAPVTLASPGTATATKPAPTVEPAAGDVASSQSDKPLSDTKSPPATSLDDDARARQTVENLKRIGRAWRAYVDDKKLHPTRAVFDRENKPLLSWRVQLLPYLGYKELYAQFHLDEPWASRNNRPLLEKIPSVYQSPERYDTSCNYLVPIATQTMFSKFLPTMESNIEDGPKNTVFVVEVDDSLAVPWTEPREYDLKMTQPKLNLGALRSGSIYVVWGDGEVGRVLTTARVDALRAMFTHDSGERFISGDIDQPLFPPKPALQPGQIGGGSSVAGSNNQTAGQRSTSTHGAQPAADAALTTLAANYLENSEIELATGGERAAGDWFYAAAIASPSSESWTDKYQWVPALRRPMPPVRFGVGLQYTGPRANEVRDASARDSSGSKPAAWTLVTKKVGDELVKVLSAHLESDTDGGAAAGKRPTPVRRRGSPLDVSPGGPLAPGVYYLATAREGVLREAAEREGVDVLVLVDWREVGANNNYSAHISLIDVARNQTLVELPRIDSAQIEKAKTDPLAANPLAIAMQKLSEFLEEQLKPEPLPSKIEPRHVAGRFSTLASSKPDNPLRTLAEMRYYRERGLATDAQLLLGYQSLIGQQPGSELFLGDAAAKARVLKPWLPRPPDRSTAQRTLSTYSSDD